MDELIKKLKDSRGVWIDCDPACVPNLTDMERDIIIAALKEEKVETERYIEYGETAIKLGLMIVAVGLGSAAAVFGLGLAIYATLQMLGLR